MVFPCRRVLWVFQITAERIRPTAAGDQGQGEGVPACRAHVGAVRLQREGAGRYSTESFHGELLIATAAGYPMV